MSQAEPSAPEALQLARLIGEKATGHPVEALPPVAEFAGWIDSLLARFDCSEPPPADRPSIGSAFLSGSADPTSAGPTGYDRFLLRYMLLLSEITYRRLWNPAPEPDPGLLEHFLRLMRHHPPLKLELYQCLLDPQSSLRRAAAIRHALGPGLHSVLFVGDDDATSIALALLEPNWQLWVIDLDEDLLAGLQKSAAELQIDLHVETVDIRRGVPMHLAGRFDGVAADPPREFAKCLSFLRFAEECMASSPHSRLFWSDHPAWNRGYAQVRDRLPRLGLECVEVLEELHCYNDADTLPPELDQEHFAFPESALNSFLDLVDHASRAFHLDPEWLRRLSQLPQPWSHLHILRKAGTEG